MALPNILCIENGVKTLLDYEKLKFSSLDRNDIFEKRWGVMLEYYEEQQA